ncbi:arginine/serine-rich coiled-coil protein 2-like isoform X2 [Portunus trituberculatus]|uniref:arginine/serine-rich coiled-coil protein 2-like isoform X2 n=1 Tax=Portunus trituberculatus TaxID=210409 RepID=UPI001E1CEB4D|nr:arginine/serine-rich coiled-coil protein 2-like isoform X2 [Portunus trituberculatus]
MSSDSEEENGVQRDAEDSDGGNYSRHSRSRSRSRSSGRSPPRDDDMDEEQHGQDRKENGMRGGGSDEYSSKKYDGQRNASRSKSPENKDAMEWSAPPATDDNKRASRSRSKSKPRDQDVAKEQKSSSSSSKKKSRSRRSRSRSRSKRRSRSRRRTRSRSRSYNSRSRRRSRSRSRRRSRSRSRRRSRSRSRSRSGTPVDGARLHVAELDVDTRKRDLERVFEKYGRLREIWMARNPPCFAFVVYAHQKDADRALKETDGITIGHCRIKVTQARPRVRGGRMRGGYDPNLRCYQCGELGHFSRNCTDTKFGYKRPPTPPGVTFSLLHSMETTGKRKGKFP